jgi:hypothetical protein
MKMSQAVQTAPGIGLLSMAIYAAIVLTAGTVLFVKRDA